MITTESIDLDIFFREGWDDTTNTTTIANHLTIDVYHYYKTTSGASLNKRLDILIECDLKQTIAIINNYYERGADFWIDFREAALPRTIVKTIREQLNTLGLNHLAER
jgi:hypothetical protein